MRLLYKYRSLDNENKKYVERIFLNNELYFPSPAFFNDPFDCKITLSMEANSQVWKKYFSRLYKEGAPQLTRTQRRLEVKDALKQKKHKFFENKFDYFENIVKPIGVYCLSEDPGQILMWSHYADSHKGIVIGFNATRNCPFFGRALPVNYSECYPDLNFHRGSPEDHALPILTTKSHHWGYEKEWRIIEHDNGHGVYKFPPYTIASVILGCEISNENTKLVESWAEKCEHRLKLYKATKKPQEFGLDIVEIK